MKNLLLKFKEAAVSVLPISLIVLIMALCSADINAETIWRFVVGAVFVIIGMSLFTLGADVAMLEIGNRVGSSLTKTRKLFIIIALSFFIGLIITVAEPDLMVLADQLAKVVNKYVLIIAVGVGVGVFLVLAILRIVFQVSLKKLLIVFYVALFILAAFVPKEFLSIAFDSGGVTTGPMTVPFIMALGVGIAASVGKNNNDDSFGLVALCSVGPILSVLIVGFFADTSALSSVVFSVADVPDASVVGGFFVAMPTYMKEVGIALAPIILFFFAYNAATLRVSKRTLLRITIGLAYVYVGLVVFLTGVNVGFSRMGFLLGGSLVTDGLEWLLIPIGIIMGFFIVAAEPAVHVLNSQVEEISNGTIKKRYMMISLMLGVGVAVGLAMTRVVTGISIWWVILPGYALAIILSFFVPKIFTAIAFDSGGVASGPMTATFLLPFAIGACVAKDGNIMKDAFGVVAMVAMTPLLTIQLLGLVSVIKTKKAQKVAPLSPALLIPEGADFDDEVMELDWPPAVKDVFKVNLDDAPVDTAKAKNDEVTTAKVETETAKTVEVKTAKAVETATEKVETATEKVETATAEIPEVKEEEIVANIAEQKLKNKKSADKSADKLKEKKVKAEKQSVESVEAAADLADDEVMDFAVGPAVEELQEKDVGTPDVDKEELWKNKKQP